MARERIISAEAQHDDEPSRGPTTRPQKFDEYVGQQQVITKLSIAVQAAVKRKDPVEHVLLHGPPGLGKTSLAHVIANEVGAAVHVVAGPAITRGADLTGILNRLSHGDVLFIDEIHRLPVVVEESLYSAMEDFKIDLTMEAGVHARTITVQVKPFTLIGATTRIGLLTSPMRSRFGIVAHVDFYPPEDLLQILHANARKLDLQVEAAALKELSTRSRGTPRVAIRLLRRVRDFAAVQGDGTVNVLMTQRALELEGIDKRGLDDQDRAFLRAIIDVYAGGPVGIEAVAATLGEERDTLEDVVEPYLLQQALLTRTRQGRRATRAAYEHLGMSAPNDDDSNNLFDE
ncbi:MAG TPA: Holliday junction branch migration DNA helicase RuvB [Tepidisphaeraceae bacterium]|nr:Holliday junction branch migration DNA helicase RuvB [Tepidisphaeraceae bacterium]